MPPRNVVPKPVQKPHPPLWVACSPPRHDPAGRREGHRRAELRVHRSRGRRALGAATTRRRCAEKCVPVGQAVNPQVACVTPMMLHHDENEAIAPRPRGRQLLRLLARPLLRVRRAHAGRRPTCGTSSSERRDQMGYSPEAAHRRRSSETLGAKIAAGDHDRPARRGRHARPGARVPPPLRGGRRRPGDLRAAGRHATATSTSWRASSCSGPRCCPSSSSATTRRSPPARQRFAPLIEAAIARKVELGLDGAADARRLRDEGDPQADGRHGRERDGPASCSNRSPMRVRWATRRR